MTTRIPLAEIIATIEARGRAVRKYPGNMKPDTVDTIEQNCAAGAAALRVVEQYADGLRHLIEFLRARQTDVRHRLMANPSDVEAAALLSHPAVQPVLDAFPEVVLAGVNVLSAQHYANPDGASSGRLPTGESDEANKDGAASGRLPTGAPNESDETEDDSRWHSLAGCNDTSGRPRAP